MKKFLAIILAALLCVGLLAGCSNGKANGKGSKSGEVKEAEPAIKTETFDAGNVKVEVPEGWKAFLAPAVFNDNPNETDPNIIRVIKGGTSDFDLFSKPYIQINYYGSDIEMMKVDKDFYEQAVELEPIKAGDHVWEGYKAKSLDTDIVMLYCEEGDNQYSASVFVGDETKGTISVADEDVLLILASVKPSK